MAISAARRAAACHRISSHLCALAPCERLPALSPHSRKRESGESGEGKGLGSRSRTRGVHRVCSKLRGLHSTVWHRLAAGIHKRGSLALLPQYFTIRGISGASAWCAALPLGTLIRARLEAWGSRAAYWSSTVGGRVVCRYEVHGSWEGDLQWGRVCTGLVRGGGATKRRGKLWSTCSSFSAGRGNPARSARP